MKNALKSFFVISMIFAASLIGYQAAFGYGGGVVSGGGASISPTVTSINVPGTVTPSQTGTISQSFGSDKVEVVVPQGAVSGATTFAISQSTASGSQAPANTTGAFMVGGNVFNINASDSSNNAVRNFSSNLNITINTTLPADTSDLGVYWFNDLTGEWVVVPGATFNSATGQVNFSVDHLTIFAIIKAFGSPFTIKSASAATIEPAKKDEPAKTDEKVLGEKTYADGSLLRGSDKKIYVVISGKLKLIANIAELRKYAGKQIFNVADSVINSYAKVAVLGTKTYGEGTLLRYKGTNQIYVVKNGAMVHVASLAELRAKYAGKPILSIVK